MCLFDARQKTLDPVIGYTPACQTRSIVHPKFLATCPPSVPPTSCPGLTNAICYGVIPRNPRLSDAKRCPQGEMTSRRRRHAGISQSNLLHSYSSKLFAAPRRVNPFGIGQIHTPSQNTRGRDSLTRATLAACRPRPLATTSLFSYSYKTLVSPVDPPAPLFSCVYEPLFQQLLCIHINTKHPGVALSAQSLHRCGTVQNRVCTSSLNRQILSSPFLMLCRPAHFLFLGDEGFLHGSSRRAFSSRYAHRPTPQR